MVVQCSRYRTLTFSYRLLYDRTDIYGGRLPNGTYTGLVKKVVDKVEYEFCESPKTEISEQYFQVRKYLTPRNSLTFYKS